MSRNKIYKMKNLPIFLDSKRRVIIDRNQEILNFIKNLRKISIPLKNPKSFRMKIPNSRIKIRIHLIVFF